MFISLPVLFLILWIAASATPSEGSYYDSYEYRARREAERAQEAEARRVRRANRLEAAINKAAPIARKFFAGGVVIAAGASVLMILDTPFIAWVLK